MRKGSILATLIILGILLVLSACGETATKSDVGATPDTSSNEDQKGEPITLKLAHIAPEIHSVGQTAKKLGEELQELTDDRISLEIYPFGQLGNERDMMQQLNDGSIDMALITTAELSTRSDAFGAWLLPYLVDTQKQAYELWTSKESMALFDTLKDENVKGLGYTASGFRWFLTNTPVESIEDLKNMKIRVTPSPTTIQFFESLGVSPTPMPLTGVYTALQTGVIDGIEIDSEVLRVINLHEIAKHLTPSGHVIWVVSILINKDTWNKLSSEDKEIMQSAVEDTSQYILDLVISHEKETLATISEEHDVVIHEFKDLSEFDKPVEKIRNEWAAKSDYIKRFLEKAVEIKQ